MLNRVWPPHPNVTKNFLLIFPVKGVNGLMTWWVDGVISWLSADVISRPRVARAGTNKLKCRENPHWVLNWQKPPQSATFWRNFNGL